MRHVTTLNLTERQWATLDRLSNQFYRMEIPVKGGSAKVFWTRQNNGTWVQEWAVIDTNGRIVEGEYVCQETTTAQKQPLSPQDLTTAFFDE